MTLSARNAEISFTPSRMLFAAIVVIHALAGVSLLLATIPVELKLALGFALLSSLLHEAQKMLVRSSRHLSVDEQREPRFVLTTDNGHRVHLKLMSPVVLLAWLVVMNFRDESDRMIPVVLLPDCTDGDEFRRFRVYLNVNGSSLFSRNGVE